MRAFVAPSWNPRFFRSSPKRGDRDRDTRDRDRDRDREKDRAKDSKDSKGKEKDSKPKEKPKIDLLSKLAAINARVTGKPAVVVSMPSSCAERSCLCLKMLLFLCVFFENHLRNRP